MEIIENSKIDLTLFEQQLHIEQSQVAKNEQKKKMNTTRKQQFAYVYILPSIASTMNQPFRID